MKGKAVVERYLILTIIGFIFTGLLLGGIPAYATDLKGGKIMKDLINDASNENSFEFTNAFKKNKICDLHIKTGSTAGNPPKIMTAKLFEGGTATQLDWEPEEFNPAKEEITIKAKVIPDDCIDVGDTFDLDIKFDGIDDTKGHKITVYPTNIDEKPLAFQTPLKKDTVLVSLFELLENEVPRFSIPISNVNVDVFICDLVLETQSDVGDPPDFVGDFGVMDFDENMLLWTVDPSPPLDPGIEMIKLEAINDSQCISFIPGLNAFSIMFELNDATDFDSVLITPSIKTILVVGGELFPINTTTLLVAGIQTNAAWMIPVMVSAIGFAIVIARKL